MIEQIHFKNMAEREMSLHKSVSEVMNIKRQIVKHWDCSLAWIIIIHNNNNNHNNLHNQDNIYNTVSKFAYAQY